ASYFHSPARFLTPETISWAVRVGPEESFRGSSCPVARIFTLCPPTSQTSTLMAKFLSENRLRADVYSWAAEWRNHSASPGPFEKLAFRIYNDDRQNTRSRVAELGRVG